jgi:DNA-binding GntR family transcriptional regulator
VHTVESPDGTAPDTEAQRVYRFLKRDILAAEFAPGQPLAETALSHRYGASRTPLREALQRLNADGLVRIEPRRGAFVQALSVTDFLEINELRSILEPHAARLAAHRLAPETLQRLAASHAAISPTEPSGDEARRLAQLDSDVHAAIAEASGNSRLHRLIHGLDDMMQVMRVGDMRRRHRETHDSLGEILAALAARDPDAAEAALRRHISDFRSAIVHGV